MAGAGGQFGMLLSGNAVCYAAGGHRAPALTIGEWQQSHAPDLSADVAALGAKGVPLYAVEEDLEERGLRDAKLVDSIKLDHKSRAAAAFRGVSTDLEMVDMEVA